MDGETLKRIIPIYPTKVFSLWFKQEYRSDFFTYIKLMMPLYFLIDKIKEVPV